MSTRTWTGRTATGQFAPGHPHARLGWLGLVQRQFGGDERAAKAYFAQHSIWRYGQQTGIRRAGAFLHPGTPADFMAQRQADWLNDEIDFMGGRNQ